MPRHGQVSAGVTGAVDETGGWSRPGKAIRLKTLMEVKGWEPKTLFSSMNAQLYQYNMYFYLIYNLKNQFNLTSTLEFSSLVKNDGGKQC
jgi:hypothetical protein